MQHLEIKSFADAITAIKNAYMVVHNHGKHYSHANRKDVIRFINENPNEGKIDFYLGGSTLLKLKIHDQVLDFIVVHDKKGAEHLPLISKRQLGMIDTANSFIR